MIEIRGENIKEPDGDLDEIIGRNVDVHLERMDEAAWCLILNDGPRKLIVNLGAVRATPRSAPPTRYGFIYADDVEESAQPATPCLTNSEIAIRETAKGFKNFSNDLPATPAPRVTEVIRTDAGGTLRIIESATPAPELDDELDEDGVPYKATPAQSS